MEYSYGIIPLKKRGASTWLLLMVKHRAGHWSFPKGRPEPGESHEQTAVRELKEETQLEVIQMLEISPLKEFYRLKREGRPTEKWVTYYPAEVEGEVQLQVEELQEWRWVSPEEAAELATFPECKRVCDEISRILKT